MKFIFFLMLDAAPAWLRLTRCERSDLTNAHIGRQLAARPALRMRHFDAEAFASDCSDVMMIETEDAAAYYDFIEELRDSPFLTEPYFRIVRILPTVEDGYRDYQRRVPMLVPFARWT